MKNILTSITALALLLSTSSLSAQLSVGGIFGMNIASVSVDPEPSSENYTSRLGIQIGGVVDYNLSENLGFRGELLILGKGGGIEESGDKAKYAITYLEIPLMIKYNFALSTPDYVPYAIAGPSIGFLTSAKAKFGSDSNDIKDEVKGIDFSLTFGAGLQVPQDNFTPFVEVRYALGLSNTNAEADDDPDESTVKTRSFIIAVGVTVPLDIN